MKISSLLRPASLGLALVSTLTSTAIGATAHLTPVMDTSLMENVPDNNTGAMLNLVSGSVANGKRTRALLRFDVSGSLPDAAVIEGASLRLTALKSPPGPVAPGSRFGLHRVLVDWIEGTKGPGNTGAPGTAGEPTWNIRSVEGEAWSIEGGGLDDTDFASATSSEAEIDLPGDYTIASTPALVADVQSWICHPSSNFGWVLISDLESAGATARRFGSKESTASQMPTLTLEYSISSPEIRISEVQRNEDSVVLRWSGNASEYQVQQRLTIDGPWIDLGQPVGCERTATVPLQGQAAFLRVISR